MTKKEVINELELKYAAEHEEYKKQYDSYHSGAMAAIDEAIQIVEKLDDTEQKWIPVSERLPEEPNYYEVTIEYDNKQRTETSYYSTKEGRWGTYTNYVTAWRERLPEPYKAGEQELNIK